MAVVQPKIDVDFIRNVFESLGVTDASEELYSDFASRLEVVQLKKSTIVDKTGEVCNTIGFVVSGLLRMFYYKNEKEVTEGFVKEGRAFTAIESYFSKTKTNVFLEAEEDTIYYRTTYEDVEELCKKYKEFDFFYQQSMIAVIKTLNLYAEILQLESADEKYEVFCREFADVVLQVPSVHIASCLGVTPETLSRVRGRRYK